MRLLSLDQLLVRVYSAGIANTDTEDTKAIKKLLVLLASLMSMGGLVWGVLLSYFELYTVAILPFGYVAISCLNLCFLCVSKNHRVAIFIQIMISLFLPFLCQWLLGGFFASGVVMLWSTLALIGAITLLKGRRVYPWLFLYVFLTFLSFWLDPQIAHLRPSIFSAQVSMILLLMNVIMIVSIVFVLAKAKTDKDIEIKHFLSKSSEALMLAKEQAEESNRLKTIFLGNLSHEVRTPLQGIQGMAELLEMPSLTNAKRSEFLQIIKRRTNDLQNIIESLLDLASMESGEIKPFPTQVDLYQLLEDTYQKGKQDALHNPKQISFQLINNIEPGTVVCIDPYHLNQVLTNLINNATKFTDKGFISLSCQQVGNEYVVKLTDTGIGIPPESIEHIFKPFRQAHEGLSRSKGGIGLGLAICQQMAEMWNGKITVQSTPGVGSVFSFTIPVQHT
jgi:signal transduction histidine kinase